MMPLWGWPFAYVLLGMTLALMLIHDGYPIKRSIKVGIFWPYYVIKANFLGKS